MFRNYLAAALRNLVRNRLYAAINVVGLAVGLAVALLIALFVRDEFSYDRWIPGHERIYRVAAVAVQANRNFHMGIAPLGAGPLLQQEFPQIEAVTRFVQNGSSPVILRHGDVESVDKLYWADANIFDVLPFPLIAGDGATALQQPDTVVLTRSMARKYFGRDNPVGETLEFNRQHPMRVTAVLEDLPSNTQFDMKIIASGSSSYAPQHFRDVSQPNSAVLTYVRLAKGAVADEIRQGLPDFNRRHPEFQKAAYPWFLDELVPIADIHLLPPDLVGQMKPAGNATVAYYASLIAALIVIIASINFVNLTTASALRRSVEVGVRKSSGALRFHLIAQFIIEATFYGACGMVAAVALSKIMLPPFNSFLDREIALDLGDPMLIGGILAVVVVVGFLAGVYPAFIMSRFAPAVVLKGGRPSGLKGGRARDVLVALQFSILIGLTLISTLIARQATYAMNGALRFDKDQMLLLNNAPCTDALIAGMRALPGVRGAACSNNLITQRAFPIDIGASDGAKLSASEAIVDIGYFELYGLTPVAGRFFANGFGGDLVPAEQASKGPSAVVINETLSRALGFATPEAAIGQLVRWTPRLVNFINNISETSSQIIGVVPDFARGTVRDAVEPQIYWATPAGGRALNIKLVGNQVPETLAQIDAVWTQLGPPRPILRVFLEQSIEELYAEVVRLNTIVAAFAAVAVFIASLGLFGLAAFAAEQRTKEIGVRKALGAHTQDILLLLLWSFTKPVIWASLFAWPVTYFVMQRWLEGFADRVAITWWMFPLASLLALAIAMLTVIGHAFLIARAQPVAALRYE